MPKDRIVFDFAGIRTLDTVIRARKVFLQNSVTFISQDFQNERALFIADNNEIKAVGFNALKPKNGFTNRVAIREFFARIMCVLDVYVLNTQPKFLGDPIKIGKASLPKSLSNKPVRLTSPIKKLTDNALKLREYELIKKYEPLAKKISDNAAIIKYRQEQEQRRLAQARAESEALENAQDPQNSIDQEKLLEQEQAQALESASETAQESLNAGSSNTYIDPNQTQDNPEP